MVSYYFDNKAGDCRCGCPPAIHYETRPRSTG